MSFAYLALFTGDYLRDTRHLSCCEHGVYLLMLFYCWDQRGPLPLDERIVAAICGARSGDEIKAVRRVLAEFFVQMEDGYYNRRMQKEIERMMAISGKRRIAGSIGGKFRAKNLPQKDKEANAKHLLSKCQALAKQMPLTPSPSPSPSPSLRGGVELSQGGTPLASRDEASRSAGETVNGFSILIPLCDGSEFGISETLVAEFDALYPAVDVMQTLREIRGWNLANPTKRKTRKGVLKHVNAWLAKEQNRG